MSKSNGIPVMNSKTFFGCAYFVWSGNVQQAPCFLKELPGPSDHFPNITGGG
jgi:hypothetical protein